jgi:hypothetical protein
LMSANGDLGGYSFVVMASSFVEFPRTNNGRTICGKIKREKPLQTGKRPGKLEFFVSNVVFLQNAVRLARARAASIASESLLAAAADGLLLPPSW